MPKPRKAISSRLRSRNSSSPNPVTPSRPNYTEESVDKNCGDEVAFSPRRDNTIYLDEINTTLSYVRGSEHEKERVLLEEANKVAYSFGKTQTRSSSFYKANIVPPIQSKRGYHLKNHAVPLKSLPPSFIINKRQNQNLKNETKKKTTSLSPSPVPNSTPPPIIPSSSCSSQSALYSNHNPNLPSGSESLTQRWPSTSEEEKKRRMRVKRLLEFKRLEMKNNEIPDMNAPRATRSRNNTPPKGKESRPSPKQKVTIKKKSPSPSPPPSLEPEPEPESGPIQLKKCTSPPPVKRKRGRPKKTPIIIQLSNDVNDKNTDSDSSTSSSSSIASHSSLVSDSSTSSKTSNSSIVSVSSDSSNSSASSDSSGSILSFDSGISANVNVSKESESDNDEVLAESESSGSEFSDGSYDEPSPRIFYKKPLLRSNTSRKNTVPVPKILKGRLNSLENELNNPDDGSDGAENEYKSFDSQSENLKDRYDYADQKSRVESSKPAKRGPGRPRKMPRLTSLSPERRLESKKSKFVKKVTFSCPIVANSIPRKRRIPQLSAVIRPSVIPIPLVFTIPENTDMDSKEKADEYYRRQRRLFVHSRYIDDDEAVLVALSVYSNQSVRPNDELVQKLQENFQEYREELKRIFDRLSSILTVTKKKITMEDRALKLFISDKMTEKVLKSVWEYWIEDPYVNKDEFYACEASVSLLKEVTVKAVICHYKKKYDLVTTAEYVGEMRRLDRITRALHLPEVEDD